MYVCMCVCMYVRTHVCARVCVVSRHARTCCAPSFCQLHMEAFTPKQGSVGVAVPCLSHSPPLAEDAEHPITTALHAPHHPSLVRICDSRTVWHRMHTNILICKHTHLYECTLTWGCVCVCVCVGVCVNAPREGWTWRMEMHVSMDLSGVRRGVKARTKCVL